jgi:Protein of unknown function (DUF3568)
MNLKQIMAMVLVGACLQGCAAAAVSVAEAGAGAGLTSGLEQSLSGIVYKTFTAPLNNVRFATLKTLDRMRMPVTVDEKTDSGWLVTATAQNRTIDIELERVTAEVTRMRVVANKGAILFKDGSTAAEIILQTAQSLQDGGSNVRAPARATAKRNLL